MRSLFRWFERIKSGSRKNRQSSGKEEIPLEPDEILTPEALSELPDPKQPRELSRQEPSTMLPDIEQPAELPSFEQPALLEPPPGTEPPGRLPLETEALEEENDPKTGFSWKLPAFGARNGYASSREHLMDELWRIDQYVHAQIVRWRETIAQHKPEQQWGMLRVSTQEIDDYLKSGFNAGDDINPNLEGRLKIYWQRASAKETEILKRRLNTPSSITLRLDRLVKLFGLEPLERDLLLFCLLPEIDARYRRLYSYLQDDTTRTQPTIELALQVFYRPGDAPGSERHQRLPFELSSPLVAFQLLHLNTEPAGETLDSMRAIRLDERITAYLLDSDEVDGQLKEVLFRAKPNGWSDFYLEKNDLNRLFRLGQRLQNDTYEQDRLNRLAQKQQSRADVLSSGKIKEPPFPVVFLHGPYGSGRRMAAGAICATAGLPILVADLPTAHRSPQAFPGVIMCCYREAEFQGAALYWHGCETLLDPAISPIEWEMFVRATEGFSGLIFLASESAWDPRGHFHERQFISYKFPVPEYTGRLEIWKRSLAHEVFQNANENRQDLSEDLARAFQFTEGQARDALVSARGEALKRDPRQAFLLRADLYEGCRRQSARQLISFAHRMERREGLTLQDVILPGPNKHQLRELLQRIRLRNEIYIDLGYERRLGLGKGLVALFTGTSGTGKTMASALLAQEIGVDAYRVDLSAVTSKWVGETEKNLDRLFAEAESSNAILFFDEADALFGKRGEVKEAQDRWANMEVNYLLQRIEEYSGTVILASNLRQNIDPAFMRRVQLLVDFPFPDDELRYQIFLRTFPPTVRIPSGWRLRFMAQRFQLTGGSLKNIVLDATFRARAEAGPPTENEAAPSLRIQNRHLVLSTASEYQKLGKPITRSEFGRVFFQLLEREMAQQNRQDTF